MAGNDGKQSQLAAMNSATLGVTMPEITLPNGIKVQTGTVGAMLVNIKAYNEAFAANDTESLSQNGKNIESAIPLLHKVGLFELFTTDEWMAGNNEGRKFVGQKYLEYKERLGI